MTILFVGGEMGAFVPADATVVEDTFSGRYDSSFARCGLSLGGIASYAEGTPSAAVTDGWTRFNMKIGDYPAITTPGKRFIWQNGSGVDTVRLYEVRPTLTTAQLRMDWWNGAAWVQAGSNIDVPVTALQTYHVHAVCNSASGSVKLYLGGTLRIDSGTINLSGTTSLKKVRFYGGTAGTPSIGDWVSEVIIADESTIGLRATTAPATGAGATTDWTGGYTEIDETVYSDTDFVNSSVVNQVELFAHSTAIPTGYRVRAVAVTARAKCGATGPQHLQLALRSAGTTYFSASQLLDAGYGAFINIWEDDPATGAAFTASAIAALQFGVKSIT